MYLFSINYYSFFVEHKMLSFCKLFSKHFISYTISIAMKVV